MKRALTPSLPCDTECSVHKAASVLDGKWTTLIFRDLLTGKKRYSELLRSLHGISPKMLTVRLKFLEEHGLIMKRIYATVPVTTEYALTPLGMRAKSVIQSMTQFGNALKNADVK